MQNTFLDKFAQLKNKDEVTKQGAAMDGAQQVNPAPHQQLQQD